MYYYHLHHHHHQKNLLVVTQLSAASVDDNCHMIYGKMLIFFIKMLEMFRSTVSELKQGKYIDKYSEITNKAEAKTSYKQIKQCIENQLSQTAIDEFHINV